jgi:flagellar basal body-associated protein FliL
MTNKTILLIALVICVVLTLASVIYALLLKKKLRIAAKKPHEDGQNNQRAESDNTSNQVPITDLGDHFEVKHFEPQMAKWHMAQPELFAGNLVQKTNYQFKLTPPNPHNTRVSYFTIELNMVLNHKDNGTVFLSTIEIVYQILNNQIKPSPEFLFEIVKHSTYLANQMVLERRHDDMALDLLFAQPLFNELYADLLQQILLVYI